MNVRSKMTPRELACSIGKGLLSFPVTHFMADLGFDEAGYRAHCSWLLDHDVAGLFAAGGTGEFFSLSAAELQKVVIAAVEEARGRRPVIAGAGYGTAIAVEMAKIAEHAGADGILLLPPYLVTPSQAGLAAHVKAVCAATSLGVIVYNRDNAVMNEDTLYRLCGECPNLVGFKDGIGDIELMMRVYSRLGDRLTYIGGLPTAETFAMPYMEMGVTTYSSAIFNFMPDWALQFYRAVRRRDHATVLRAIETFVLPYISIRNRDRGYAVAIVKAGMRVSGRPAGPVRPPLTDLKESEQEELATLVRNMSRSTSGETGIAG